MKVEVNMSGLDGVLETLESIPREIASKRGGPVRRALAKAAILIRDQAKSNFRAAVALPGKSGVTDSTGFTEERIIVKRRQLNKAKGERYIVTVKSALHPSGRLYSKSRLYKRTKKNKMTKDIALTSNDIAFMMENGTAKQPATPWLRPAFAARAGEAIRTFETELLRDIQRIVKKLAAKNRGR